MNNDVSIKFIAEKSGYSVSTVSRVINGNAREYRISEATEKKILDLAKKFEYEANPVAVNLRLKKSHTVGLIIPSLDNPFFVNVTSILNKELDKRGYNIILTESYEDPLVEEKVVKRLLSRNIDGLLLIPSRYRDKNTDLFKNIDKQGIPIVCIDRYLKNTEIPFVITDNKYGAYIGGMHLIENGHTKIACIQGLPDSTPNKDRKSGFIKALEENNLSPFYLGGDSFSIECGYRVMKSILRKKEKPTAIFAFSSNIALGIIKAAREKKFNIPNDMSLICFDNNVFLDYTNPPLTTIAQPIKNISHIAANVLIENIDATDKPSEFKNKILKPDLIIRESVQSII